MKIRITLCEKASDELLQLMEHLGHSSPSHTCNQAVTALFKQVLQRPSHEENITNGNSTLC